MYRVTAAGFSYAGIVFAVGFVVGTIRVLFVVPRVGETAAVSIESPVMLAVSWTACSWIVKRFELPKDLRLRTSIGIVAFATLTLLELGLSVFVFRRSFAEHFAAYRTPPGLIGLAAQIAFAIFPSFLPEK